MGTLLLWGPYFRGNDPRLPRTGVVLSRKPYLPRPLTSVSDLYIKERVQQWNYSWGTRRISAGTIRTAMIALQGFVHRSYEPVSRPGETNLDKAKWRLRRIPLCFPLYGSQEDDMYPWPARLPDSDDKH